MKPTRGEVVATTDTETTKETLFTYSEEEKQQHEIDAVNARLVYTPEFIPFYSHVQKEYKLTDKETLLYGFIRFYLSTAKDKRFYFNNKQLGEIIGVSEKHITNLMQGLRRKMKLPIRYKPRAGGGTIRFINSSNFRTQPRLGSEPSESST